jgi:hypothetical protein
VCASATGEVTCPVCTAGGSLREREGHRKVRGMSSSSGGAVQTDAVEGCVCLPAGDGTLVSLSIELAPNHPMHLCRTFA